MYIIGADYLPYWITNQGFLPGEGLIWSLLAFCLVLCLDVGPVEISSLHVSMSFGAAIVQVFLRQS